MITSSETYVRAWKHRVAMLEHNDPAPMVDNHEALMERLWARMSPQAREDASRAILQIVTEGRRRG